jgi:hypothetical protein
MAINPQGIASLDLVAGANVVDGLNYRVEFSKVLAQNIFVQLRTRVGQSVTGKYVPNGIKAGHVVINRVKRAGMEPRTLGSATNGSLLNSAAKKAIATDQYHVQLLHVYDNVFTIPRVAATLMPVDLVNETLYNISGEIQEFIDASTIATMLLGVSKLEEFGSTITAGSFVAGKRYEIVSAGNTDFTLIGSANSTVGTQFLASGVGTGTGTAKEILDYHVELPSSLASDSLTKAIREAVKILKKGDLSNGIAIFEPTAILARPGFAMDLLSSAGVIVGGSNFAQEMIAKGVLSPEAAYLQYGNGTRGMVYSYPVIEVPDLIFDLAKEWVTGTSAAAFKTFVGKVEALVVSDIATVRGIADEYMDVRQSTEVNATNLLPLYQWGVESMFGKGVVPIVSNGTAELTPDQAASIKLIGKGSQA